MAGLALRFDRRELNPALGSVGELKNVIAHSVLEERGFSNVVDTELEVAGNRPGLGYRACISSLRGSFGESLRVCLTLASIRPMLGSMRYFKQSTN
jgi:hypothetical protein